MTGVTLSLDDARALAAHHGVTNADAMSRPELTSALMSVASRITQDEATQRRLPMRWPTQQHHVDIAIISSARVRWEFRSDADRRAFECLEPGERDALRRGFDATTAGMLERMTA
jgi:hypothetical protein